MYRYKLIKKGNMPEVSHESTQKENFDLSGKGKIQRKLENEGITFLDFGFEVEGQIKPDLKAKLTQLSAEEQEIFKDAVEGAKVYLSHRLFVDRFADHQRRREFRGGLSRDEDEVFSANRIRGNKLSGDIFYPMEPLELVLSNQQWSEQDKEVLNATFLQAQEILQKLHSTYKSASNDEKKMFVDKVTQTVRIFLEWAGFQVHPKTHF
jgi:hypothetical protein